MNERQSKHFLILGMEMADFPLPDGAVNGIMAIGARPADEATYLRLFEEAFPDVDPKRVGFIRQLGIILQSWLRVSRINPMLRDDEIAGLRWMLYGEEPKLPTTMESILYAIAGVKPSDPTTRPEGFMLKVDEKEFIQYKLRLLFPGYSEATGFSGTTALGFNGPDAAARRELIQRKAAHLANLVFRYKIEQMEWQEGVPMTEIDEETGEQVYYYSDTAERRALAQKKLDHKRKRFDEESNIIRTLLPITPERQAANAAEEFVRQTQQNAEDTRAQAAQAEQNVVDANARVAQADQAVTEKQAAFDATDLTDPIKQGLAQNALDEAEETARNSRDAVALATREETDARQAANDADVVATNARLAAEAPVLLAQRAELEQASKIGPLLYVRASAAQDEVGEAERDLKKVRVQDEERKRRWDAFLELGERVEAAFIDSSVFKVTQKPSVEAQIYRERIHNYDKAYVVSGAERQAYEREKGKSAFIGDIQGRFTSGYYGGLGVSQ